MKLSGLNIFRQYAKKLLVKSRTRSLPRPQIKTELSIVGRKLMLVTLGTSRVKIPALH